VVIADGSLSRGRARQQKPPANAGGFPIPLIAVL